MMLSGLPSSAAVIPPEDPVEALLSPRRLWHWWLEMPRAIRDAETADDLLEVVRARHPATSDIADLAGHRAVEGRIWWDSGKVVHRFTLADAKALAVEARRVLGQPWIHNIPSLRRATEEGSTWGAYFEIVDSADEPCALMGGALIHDGTETWMEAEFRLRAPGHDQGVLALAAVMRAHPGRINTPKAIRAAIESSESRRKVMLEELSLAAWWLVSMAWAVESPITRSTALPTTKPPRRETRRQRRLRRERATRTAQVKTVRLVPRADQLGVARASAPIPAPAPDAPPSSSTTPTISWAPAHTGVRWVREDNVQEEDDLIDVKERNGRIYYACIRPIRGWGESPHGARVVGYQVDKASE